jgi:hypothetical protein
MVRMVASRLSEYATDLAPSGLPGYHPGPCGSLASGGKIPPAMLHYGRRPMRGHEL